LSEERPVHLLPIQVEPPPTDDTVIDRDPMRARRSTFSRALSDVVDCTTTLLADTPPPATDTVAPLPKPTPVIVTSMPSPGDPLFALTAVMRGALIVTLELRVAFCPTPAAVKT
jgi:hypothetical protein